ncbi:MAG: DUF177 domain-containing protein [Bacteroidetes bacterium]|nr:DUF177 domain-containing protein [Bacteroidota bacterium]
MDKLSKYSIPFAGLSVGNHHFNFSIEDAFFENFEFSEIQKANIVVNIEFQKQSAMFILLFEISGTVNIVCDRCLDNFDFPIQGNYKLIVKFGDNQFEETDEILIIPEKEHQVNISQYIYEYIHLCLPLQRIHPENEAGESECNPDVLEKLNKHKNLRNPEEPIDERWNALKNIKLN